jgi:hypothetical protein
MSSAESIVTKRVALGELKFQARNEPPYWLTQNAVSLSLRRFAFTPSLFKGLRRFGSGGSDSLSEPVALRVRAQPSWLSAHPVNNRLELSESLFNKRCYLTTRLLSHPRSNAFGKIAGEWVCTSYEIPGDEKTFQVSVAITKYSGHGSKLSRIVRFRIGRLERNVSDG